MAFILNGEWTGSTNLFTSEGARDVHFKQSNGFLSCSSTDLVSGSFIAYSSGKQVRVEQEWYNGERDVDVAKCEIVVFIK